jgi:hypothetical protein
MCVFQNCGAICPADGIFVGQRLLSFCTERSSVINLESKRKVNGERQVKGGKTCASNG